MSINSDPVIVKIDIEKVLPNPNQPRKHFNNDTLEELCDSIKTYGLISPIQVRNISNDLYELVAGERRLKASKLAGLKEIPAIVVHINDQDSAVLSIIENIQRENLTFFEEANSYKKLIEHYQMTQEQIANALGKSQSFVANKIRLLRLPQSLIKTISENKLSERHARALLRIPDEELQTEVVDKVVKNDLNVRRTEELVEKIRNDVLTNNYGEKISPGKKARVKSFINAQIYINTIKSAFKMVKDSRKTAEYKEIDKPEFVEIRIKIPK